MNRIEFKAFLDRQLQNQGTASSLALPELAKELLQHIPCVVHISEESSVSNGSTVYKVIDTQPEIDDIIKEIDNNEMACVVVHNKGVTLHFDHIEIEDDVVICYLAAYDGLYTLTLSKEENMSELSHTPSA